MIIGSFDGNVYLCSIKDVRFYYTYFEKYQS